MKPLLAFTISLTLALSAAAQDAPPPPPVPEPAADAETQKKIDALIVKLGSDDWDERSEAEKELETLGKVAVPSLRKAMETAEDPEVKVRAKRVLQKLGGIETPTELDDSAFEELLDSLRAQDGVSWYRRNSKPYFYMYQLYERQDFANALKDPKFAPRLAKALDDSNGNLKRNIAWLLGEIGNPEVAVDVISLLKDSEPLTRAVALYAAGKLGNVAVAGDVVKALVDEDSLVRQSAAAALENLPTPDAIEPLLTALKDEDAKIRFHAYFSLRSLTGQKIRFNAWSDADSRAEGVKQFDEWWSKNKAGFKPLLPKKVEKEKDDEGEEPAVRVR